MGEKLVLDVGDHSHSIDAGIALMGHCGVRTAY